MWPLAPDPRVVDAVSSVTRDHSYNLFEKYCVEPKGRKNFASVGRNSTRIILPETVTDATPFFFVAPKKLRGELEL